MHTINLEYFLTNKMYLGLMDYQKKKSPDNHLPINGIIHVPNISFYVPESNGMIDEFRNHFFSDGSYIIDHWLHLQRETTPELFLKGLSNIDLDISPVKSYDGIISFNVGHNGNKKRQLEMLAGHIKKNYSISPAL